MSIKEDISKGWNDIPSPIRGVIYLGLLGGIGFLAYKWYKGSAEKDAIKNDIDTLKSKKVLQSFPSGNYKLFADSLEGAMFGVGTDFNAVMNVFKSMKTDLDIALLIEAFGTRRGEFTLIWSNLGEWLTGDLSDSQMNALNNLLASKKITYRF